MMVVRLLSCAAGTITFGAILSACSGTADTSRGANPSLVDRSVSSQALASDYVETIAGTAVQFDLIWISEGQFWIGRTEVTWDAYLPYCDFDETGAVLPGVDAVSKPSKPLDVMPYHRDWGIEQRPAVGMSWNAAKKYCEWLSLNTGHRYRLPTEAEWELASGGDPVQPLTEVAWVGENTNGRTEQVGMKQPNRFGVHDMLGNLWEYCLDPFDPARPDRAVLRGGSWQDSAAEVTSTARLQFSPAWVLNDPNMPPGVWWVPDGGHLGFRVLRESSAGRSGDDPTRP